MTLVSESQSPLSSEYRFLWVVVNCSASLVVIVCRSCCVGKHDMCGYSHAHVLQYLAKIRVCVFRSKFDFLQGVYLLFRCVFRRRSSFLLSYVQLLLCRLERIVDLRPYSKPCIVVLCRYDMCHFSSRRLHYWKYCKPVVSFWAVSSSCVYCPLVLSTFLKSWRVVCLARPKCRIPLPFWLLDSCRVSVVVHLRWFCIMLQNQGIPCSLLDWLVSLSQLVLLCRTSVFLLPSDAFRIRIRRRWC